MKVSKTTLLSSTVLIAFSSSVLAQSELVKDKFTQVVPKAFESVVEKARAYRLPNSEQYNPDEAIQLLEGLVKQKDDYFRGYFNLGLAYGEQRQYKSAQDSFRKAIDIADRDSIPDVTVYNSAGWIHMLSGDYNGAEELYLEALERDGAGIVSVTDDVRQALYYNLGLLYFNTQKFDLAEEKLAVAQEQYDSKAANKLLAVIAKVRSDSPITVFYYPKRADGPRVKEALSKVTFATNVLQLTSNAYYDNHSLGVNYIICGAGTPAAAVREIAKSLMGRGIRLQYVGGYFRGEKNTLNRVIDIRSAGDQEYFDSAQVLDESDLENVSCTSTSRQAEWQHGQMDGFG